MSNYPKSLGPARTASKEKGSIVRLNNKVVRNSRGRLPIAFGLIHNESTVLLMIHFAWLVGIFVLLHVAQAHAQRDIGIRPKPIRSGQALYKNSWALVIGVNHYKDRRIPRLRYAEADARAVADRLQKLGFPRNNIVRLTGRRATRDAIVDSLEKMDEQMESTDRLFVFAAGHGVTAKVKGEEAGYFLP